MTAEGGAAAPCRVLTVNPGSSTLKLAVVDGGEVVLSAQTSAGTRAEEDSELGAFVERCGGFDAAAVRVVHGGSELRDHLLVDSGVVERLELVAPLAPLHNPPAVAALRHLRRLRPQTPLVACLDTAFHRTLPDAARTYALPRAWRERWGLERLGFHGLSHAHAARCAAEMLGAEDRAESAAEPLRVVTCHLGAGASLAAVRGGDSVDTTMGFTPMEGLVMATRAGTVDPGIVLRLLREHRLSVDDVEAGLDREGGLHGLAGTADMREVLTGAEAGDERCTLALDVYVHRLRAGIAAMTAALGGIDALVFTGGIGENALAVRERAVSGLAYLGLALDTARNTTASGEDRDLSDPDAAVRTLVVNSREELEMARIAERLVRWPA